MRNIILSITIISFLSLPAFGKAHLQKNIRYNDTVFKLAQVLQSNMVVQRDKPFRVWGKAAAGHTVDVKASWNKHTFFIKADTANNWMVQIPQASATFTPQTIVINDDNAVAATLSNILIGDVWICSGQSNMDMPLDSVGQYPGFVGVNDYKNEIAAANYPAIRLCKVNADFQNNPIADLTRPVQWNACTPATAARFSAAAYYFGRKLFTELNVPVGLLVSCVSATACEDWTSQKTIQGDETLNAYYAGRKNAGKLYNGMINPLRNLAIKGFTWYQGESNRDDNPVGNYTLLNQKMITNWRMAFEQGPLPFYYVQMTPFARNFFKTKPYGDDSTANDYAKFREAQAAIRTIKNTGMAVTMDANSQLIFIHPREKKQVGERLALLALNKTYERSLECEGPQYNSFKQKDTVVVINFKHANGLTTLNGGPIRQYFYIAGTDHIFRQGRAMINGDKIQVSIPPATPLPVQAVRYAFTDFPVTNIQNAAGLPMEPFRTDGWSN